MNVDNSSTVAVQTSLVAVYIIREWTQDKANLHAHATAVQQQYDIASPMSARQPAFVKKSAEANYATVQLAFANSQDWQ